MFRVAHIILVLAVFSAPDVLCADDHPQTRVMTYFERFMNAVREASVDGEVYGRDYLIDPPDPDYGYWATPANSLTFAKMGVDGVHTAIITQGDEISDDSPVVYVLPMDDPPVIVLAPSLVDFLADGCGVNRQKIIDLLDGSASDPQQVVRFVDSRFDMGRLLDDERIAAMTEAHLHKVEMKPFPELSDLE